MRFRDLSTDEDRPLQPSPVAPADGAALAGLRQAGERFIAAGDEAISRALSGNSQSFLEANRQQGGQ